MAEHDQRLGENVRHDKVVGCAVADGGIIGAVSQQEFEARTAAIVAGVFACDADAFAVNVGGERAVGPGFQGCNGQDAGACANVEDPAELSRAGEVGQSEEAPLGGAVMARAESGAGFDPDRDAAATGLCKFVGAGDDEGAGLDGGESFERHGDPVLVLERHDRRPHAGKLRDEDGGDAFGAFVVAAPGIQTPRGLGHFLNGHGGGGRFIEPVGKKVGQALRRGAVHQGVNLVHAYPTSPLAASCGRGPRRG